MRIIKRIGKVLSSEIGFKYRFKSEKFKRRAVKFLNKHGSEVASNMLAVPSSTLASWKRIYSKDKTNGK